LIFPYGAWVVLCIVRSVQHNTQHSTTNRMNKQELASINQLVEHIRKWCHENHSYKQSQSFGQVLRIINLQAAMIDELTKHGGYTPTPMTVEEKVVNAADFYALYEQLLPPMTDSDFDALPSPRQILEAAHIGDVDNVGVIPIIATGREYSSNYYVVIKLGAKYVKISCAYDGEYGFDYDYAVQIVEPQQKVWCPV
jgi:hypothetical protein